MSDQIRYIARALRIDPDEIGVVLATPGSRHWLYLIKQSGAGFYVKIGHAKSMRERLVALQCGNPMLLKISALWMCGSRGDAGALEANLHQKFDHNRCCGEWFDMAAYGEAQIAIEIGRIIECGDQLHSLAQANEKFRIFDDEDRCLGEIIRSRVPMERMDEAAK